MEIPVSSDWPGLGPQTVPEYRRSACVPWPRLLGHHAPRLAQVDAQFPKLKAKPRAMRPTKCASAAASATNAVAFVESISCFSQETIQPPYCSAVPSLVLQC